MALLATVMIMMLLSALMVGFVSAIVEDQTASGLNRDQTQAYAAAHAGLEQLTSDMTALFRRDVSPSRAQINALTAQVPVIAGFEFRAPDGSVGYTAIPTFVDGNGNPLPEDVNGSDITHGPFQGLKGIITPYEMTVTARSRGMAEVRLRRTLQTVAIPVFQFGMFSETNLAFHAGDPFTFGGRVHTNANLYLAQANGSTLTLGDRVTAVGEVVRWALPNGTLTDNAGGYAGTVNMIRATATYRALARNEGSLTMDMGSPQNEPRWTNLSVGTYNNYIRNGRTGVRRLDLPLVADMDGNGVPDARPIDIIKRPPPGNADPAAVLQQRYFSLASLRILLSDTAADITDLPTIAAGAPVALNIGTAYAPGVAPLTRPPLATSNGNPAWGALGANVYKSDHDEPLINGFIKIEMQRQDGTWVDVTGEILDLGIAGRNIADRDEPVATRWNNVPEGAADTCQEPQPNSIIRLQRIRDIPTENPPCGFVGVWPAVTAVSQDFHDYWPLALYDTREGQMRDGLAGTTLYLGGIIHYVELDVNNLRRWFLGQIGFSGNQARNENGFTVYFSDRRNNRNNAGNETGEYGYEDVVNPPNMNATNGNLDTGEDLNGNGVLDVYGAVARNVPACNAPCDPVPFDAAAVPTTTVPPVGGANPAPALVARANRPVHFRRALKLVNGQQGNIIAPGFTVASENPVYVQGNYNATAASTLVNPHVATAVISDAVTLLSNNWNDIRSFTSPQDANGRVASTTGYRMAVITGKGIAFPKPGWASASFGSDGGAHNFVRLLEHWDTAGQILRYRGSFVSLFFNEQATGTFKCCLQDTYQRGARDWFFDTEFLLPNLLPPGTPMFRDVNTLTFRQLLRPTQ